MPGAKVPVILVTGFLGSGKTTLLKRLLSLDRLRSSVAVVNEFGEIALDHALLETPVERTLSLGSGCVCCTLRGDLQETLVDLMRRRRIGAIPDFERVFIESTGLADPAPVIQTFAVDVELARRYRLSRVCVTVDAANALYQLDRFPEARSQVALADTLILTKSDLVDSDTNAAVRARLAELNTLAPIFESRHGDIAPESVMERSSDADAAGWLVGEASRLPEFAAAHAGITTFCLMPRLPFPPAAVTAFLELLAKLRGPDLLRVKGLLRIEGDDRPLAIHGIHHIFHPPRFLERWPDDDRRSRIVFVVKDIPQKTVETLLEALLDPALYSGS